MLASIVAVGFVGVSVTMGEDATPATPAPVTNIVVTNTVMTADVPMFYPVVGTVGMQYPVRLYDTGVISNGALANQGTLDTHYTLISSPIGCGTSAWVAASIPTSYPSPGGWIVSTNAQWIAPASNGSQNQPSGQYDYRLTFTLVNTNGDLLNPLSASITGYWAVDNIGVLLLNGIPAATNNSSFAVLTPFTISSGFQSGTNILDFVITNDPDPAPNPTGLLVVGISCSATLSPYRQ